MATLVLAAAPLRAANKDIERLQIQISSLQGQLADLQRVSEDTLKEVKRLNESLAEQNASMRRLVADRRVQEEAISAALKDINDRVSDVSERMQTARAGAAVAAPVVTNPAPGIPPVAAGGPAAAPITPGTVGPAGPGVPNPQAPAPRELYTQAYADYARGNYDLAILEYTDYLRNYPDTDLSDNAQYWIGTCQYDKGKYDLAIEAWDELLRQYPSSDKIPDARFKKGMALERLGRRSQALLEYRFVAERFPNSEAGRKAREKLNPR
jgi:tol-pal system protein YbgF